jgi:hypothetical protein
VQSLVLEKLLTAELLSVVRSIQAIGNSVRDLPRMLHGLRADPEVHARAVLRCST